MLSERYRLIRPVGQGAQASVWVAEHLALSTQVAVKLIDPELAKQEEARERFRREATAAAQLRSAHVVQILDHGIAGEQPFIVMELLEGEDLFERLARRRRLSLQETSRIVTQVARALTRAHGAGIVHRDLKPENFFISANEDDEIVKILDFGIAKVRAQGGKRAIKRTTAGTLMGTPHYMSPEQVKGLREVDYRADLWALGVIVYQCVTGELPFDSEGVGDLLIKISIGEIPVPSRVNPELPPSFDAWFARACDREPARRFESARDLAESLARVAELSTESQGALSSPRPPPMPPAPPRPSPTRPPAAAPRPATGSSIPKAPPVPRVADPTGGGLSRSPEPMPGERSADRAATPLPGGPSARLSERAAVAPRLSERPPVAPRLSERPPATPPLSERTPRGGPPPAPPRLGDTASQRPPAPRSTGAPLSVSSAPRSTGAPLSAGGAPRSTGAPLSAGGAPRSTGAPLSAGGAPRSTGAPLSAGGAPRSTGGAPRSTGAPLSTGGAPRSTGGAPLSTSAPLTPPRSNTPPAVVDERPEATPVSPPGPPASAEAPHRAAADSAPSLVDVDIADFENDPLDTDVDQPRAELSTPPAPPTPAELAPQPPASPELAASTPIGDVPVAATAPPASPAAAPPPSQRAPAPPGVEAVEDEVPPSEPLQLQRRDGAGRAPAGTVGGELASPPASHHAPRPPAQPIAPAPAWSEHAVPSDITAGHWVKGSSVSGLAHEGILPELDAGSRRRRLVRWVAFALLALTGFVAWQVVRSQLPPQDAPAATSAPEPPAATPEPEPPPTPTPAPQPSDTPPAARAVDPGHPSASAVAPSPPRKRRAPPPPKKPRKPQQQQQQPKVDDLTIEIPTPPPETTAAEPSSPAGAESPAGAGAESPAGVGAESPAGAESPSQEEATPQAE
ncbi:uncharacterized protein SOCEGT47_072310 [Sorangium cellulosum]|uniref:Protein kinase domain-containing protein n=1 Tax=Sorangium cellulosum TaxID=56 RepID=A0A4P2QBF1_SORCE|nr:uncharacterized protein SOCEGT47_072310 [Sorangium cellulosum]